MNLDWFIDEFLSIEKPKRESFIDRTLHFLKRKEMAKQIHDEIEYDNMSALKAGNDAQEFIDSKYYKTIIEPFIKGSIKSGIQKIIKEGENLTEAQLKMEIAGIKKTLGILGAIKIRIAVADKIKAENNAV